MKDHLRRILGRRSQHAPHAAAQRQPAELPEQLRLGLLGVLAHLQRRIGPQPLFQQVAGTAGGQPAEPGIRRQQLTLGPLRIDDALERPLFFVGNHIEELADARVALVQPLQEHRLRGKQRPQRQGQQRRYSHRPLDHRFVT